MIDHTHIHALLHGLPPAQRPATLTKHERSLERIMQAIRAGEDTCTKISVSLNMSIKYVGKLLDELYHANRVDRFLRPVGNRKIYAYKEKQ